MTAAGDSPARPRPLSPVPVPSANSSDHPRLEEEKGHEVHAEHPEADTGAPPRHLHWAPRAPPVPSGAVATGRVTLPDGFASSPSTFFSAKTAERLGTG